MTAPTPEELAAFADGELSAEREAAIAQMIAADAQLAQQVERHRALRQTLSAHFAPILDQPVPDRLNDAVRPRVVDFAEAQARRKARDAEGKSLPRWMKVAAPALAACLVLAVFVSGGEDAPDGYAGPQLASALDTQLSGSQGDRETRILLSFRDKSGEFCRVFAGGKQSGIACRDDAGWKLREVGAGADAQQTEYRQAGSDEGALLAAAQEMADGGALDAASEEAARTAGWQ